MKHKQTSSASPRIMRAKRIPNVPLTTVEGRDYFAALDHDAPIGEYDIDAFGDVIEALRDTDNVFSKNAISGDELVMYMRELIEFAGGHAAFGAKLALVEKPQARRRAKALLKDLEQLRCLATRITKIDDGDLSNVLLFGIDHKPEPVGVLEIRRLITDFPELIERLETAKENTTVAKPNSGNIDPLATYFLFYIGKMWTKLTGRPQPRGASGPFVDFALAAWNDLGFPEPLDRDGNPTPLKEWLGERAHKAPVMGQRGADR